MMITYTKAFRDESRPQYKRTPPGHPTIVLAMNMDMQRTASCIQIYCYYSDVLMSAWRNNNLRSIL